MPDGYTKQERKCTTLTRMKIQISLSLPPTVHQGDRIVNRQKKSHIFMIFFKEINTESILFACCCQLCLTFHPFGFFVSQLGSQASPFMYGFLSILIDKKNLIDYLSLSFA